MPRCTIPYKQHCHLISCPTQRLQHATLYHTLHTALPPHVMPYFVALPRCSPVWRKPYMWRTPNVASEVGSHKVAVSGTHTHTQRTSDLSRAPNTLHRHYIHKNTTQHSHTQPLSRRVDKWRCLALAAAHYAATRPPGRYTPLPTLALALFKCLRAVLRPYKVFPKHRNTRRTPNIS